MILLKRTDDADDGDRQIDLDDGPVELGRGPLLRIDATNISRKHVQLRSEDGKVMLKCLHRNPVVRVQCDGTEDTIQQHEETELHSDDVIRFLPDKFYFQISIPCTPAAGQLQSVEQKPTPKKQISKPSPSSSGKKTRKLPDWMLDKEKATPNKENSPPNKSDRKTPTKRTQTKQKASTAPSSTEKEGATPKVSTPKKNESRQNVPKGPSNITKHTNQKAEPVDRHQAAGHNHKTDVAASPKVDGAAALETVETATDSVKASTSSTEASGSRTVFPVLITPEDLKDSDDEAPPKKKPDKERRPVCQYGEQCYRKNPHHFERESHPGDPDYAPEDVDKDEDDDRPECEYGVDCYRKNPVHRKQYKHTHKPQPKRKAKARTKRDEEDEYESDFIDDEDIEEDIDDTDEDEDWELPNDENE